MASQASWASSDAVRAVMQGNRSRDTKPELALRSAVHRLGLRYRVGVRPLSGLNRSADLVFRPTRVAVFLDGCYWHGCPDHHHTPRVNRPYWSAKIAGNIARDRDTDQQLEAAGWLVLRFWEHEDPGQCASKVLDAVAGRRQGS